jgi:transposase
VNPESISPIGFAFLPERDERSSRDCDADKLRAVALYQQGMHGVASIARHLGRSRAAVASWIKVWKDGGIPELLSKGEKTRTQPYRFTHEARQMLLEKAEFSDWKSCRDAWRWLTQECGVDVCYLTVWRFLSEQGLFTGEKMHARQFTPPTGLVPPAQPEGSNTSAPVASPVATKVMTVPFPSASSSADYATFTR